MVNMKLVLLIAAIYSVESLIPMLDDDQFNGLLYDTILDAGSLCVRRPYAYKAWQEDEDGKACWDWVHVTSCWGKCDSNEIPDWRFPFKKSFHPVCQHAESEPRLVTLKNCDPGVQSGTEVYVVYDAISCRCQSCKSHQMACEGLRYRGLRSRQ